MTKWLTIVLLMLSTPALAQTGEVSASFAQGVFFENGETIAAPGWLVSAGWRRGYVEPLDLLDPVAFVVDVSGMYGQVSSVDVISHAAMGGIQLGGNLVFPVFMRVLAGVERVGELGKSSDGFVVQPGLGFDYPPFSRTMLRTTLSYRHSFHDDGNTTGVLLTTGVAVRF